MLSPQTTKRFEKDLKRIFRRGKDLNKLKEVQVLLVHEIPLPERYRDHKLTGNWADHRECHIEPDWLLVYKLEPPNIIFAATGSHADLFR